MEFAASNGSPWDCSVPVLGFFKQKNQQDLQQFQLPGFLCACCTEKKTHDDLF